MCKLRDLKGLGPKSEKTLIGVGINTEQELPHPTHVGFTDR